MEDPGDDDCGGRSGGGAAGNGEGTSKRGPRVSALQTGSSTRAVLVEMRILGWRGGPLGRREEVQVERSPASRRMGKVGVPDGGSGIGDTWRS